MSDWVLSIENLAGTTVVGDLPFKALTFGYTLNGVGTLEAVLDPYDSLCTQSNLAPGLRQVILKRLGVEVWAGLAIANRVGMSQDKNHSLSLLAEGYATVLQHRIVRSDLIYTSVEPHTIMWNLINHTQGLTNGNLGLTQGSHTDNVGTEASVDREYCALDYPFILEAIQELTEIDDGSDWAVGPTISFATRKQFRTWSTRRGTDLTGSVTLDEQDLATLDYTVDATYLGNYVVNSGLDDCNPPVYIATDSTSLADYGLWEMSEDVESANKRDLRAHGNEVIRNYKEPRWIATAKMWADHGPAWGAFDIGDSITLASDVGFSNFSRSMRVLSIQLDLSGPEVDFWTITMDSVVE